MYSTKVDNIFNNASSPFKIAEVALSHDGSFNLAFAYVDAIALTGFDAVKFQTHIAESESSSMEPFRVKFSKSDHSRYDYWRRTGFSADQWKQLKEYAEQKNLTFLSSPFSIEAVDLLSNIGIHAWKISSGEVNSKSLMAHVVRTKKPLIISTGLSTYADINRLVEWLNAERVKEYALMQCTTLYPTPPQQIGMNVMEGFRNKYGCSVGLSDHSGKLWPSIVAAYLGANVIEVHVTLSRYMNGPDVTSSLTVDELKTLSDGIDFAYSMRRNPVDKNFLDEKSENARKLFSKSAMTRRSLPKDSVLKLEDLIFRKPGFGLLESEIDRYIGRKLIKPVQENQFLTSSDFYD